MFDIKNLTRLSELGQDAADPWAAFKAFDEAALKDGAIPKKYKELIALGVALTTQCGYCVEVHRRAATAAGATPEELAEATFVAAALRAGAAVTHGTHLLAFKGTQP
ncbi:MAG: carboxymuconolactone decarboxylase family protein [Pseudomonadota bacterium]|nr:carboxymuconolactone decarboxylase family protein [Pseudomonadota bacterium]